jgi:hypothetical protein
LLVAEVVLVLVIEAVVPAAHGDTHAVEQVPLPAVRRVGAVAAAGEDGAERAAAGPEDALVVAHLGMLTGWFGLCGPDGGCCYGGLGVRTKVL